MTAGETVSNFAGHSVVALALDISPDESLLATASEHGRVLVWDLATGEIQQDMQDPRSEIWGMQFSPDGKSVVVGLGDGTVGYWDVTSGKPGFQWQAHVGSIRYLGFFPDGKTLCTASIGDRSIRLWQVAP